MIRGFLLGKFMPPHAGHLFMCEVARRRVDELTVFVCTNDAEQIPGDLRAGWMRECLNEPGYRVVHMHRDIPQTPEDHPDFWAVWRDTIFEHHPEPIDWVFGSEEYVHQLASTLDAKPFVVDHQRLTVPISARSIRLDPGSHWDNIPAPVRPYFQTRITLIGPESAGKSTMGLDLADHFQTKLIPEYGRDYDAAFKSGAGWGGSDFLAIANGHLALAAAIARRAGPIVIEDTDPLQTLVWAEALLGEAPADLIGLVRQCAAPDLYLLLNPTMPWLDDGTRYHQALEKRLWFVQRLRFWMAEFGVKWIEIAGSSWQERFQQALAAVADLQGTAQRA